MAQGAAARRLRSDDDGSRPGWREAVSMAAPERVVPGSATRHTTEKTARSSGTQSRGGLVVELLAKFTPSLLRHCCPAYFGNFLADAIVLTVVLGAVHLMVPLLSIHVTAVYIFFVLATAIEEGLYSKAAGSRSSILVLTKATFWSFVLTGALLRPSLRGLEAIALAGMASFCGLCLCRWVWTKVRADECPVNAMIVGRPAFVQKMTVALDASSGHHIKAVLPHAWLQASAVDDTLGRLAREEHIDEVIVGGGDSNLGSVVASCAHHGLDAVIVPDIGHALDAEVVNGMPLVKVCMQSPPEWGLALKRVLDFGLALACVIAAGPLVGAIAVAVKLDSRGPILYRSERTGRKGRQFICYKFRTMQLGSDAEKEKLRSRNEREGAFFKINDDPRITRIGRWLRRYSLDELPQLWNVLRGEMSLVGPRPHPVDDVERYEIGDLCRLDFTPGMTGLWQVTARDDPSFQRCVALDVEYITRWSLWLDLEILCRTVPAVLRGSGT